MFILVREKTGKYNVSIMIERLQQSKVPKASSSGGLHPPYGYYGTAAASPQEGRREEERVEREYEGSWKEREGPQLRTGGIAGRDPSSVHHQPLQSRQKSRKKRRP